jgi:hypothetical protein
LFQLFAAHFGSKRTQSSVGPRDGLGFEPRDRASSVRQYSAYFAKENTQSSVGQRDNNRREIISDTYVLKRREDAISYHLFPAHFGSMKAKSPDDPRKGSGFEPSDPAIRSNSIQHI